MSADLVAMLRTIRNPVGALPSSFRPISDRKLRLFACACCRQFWRLLTDERSRKAVEVAERYADGDATIKMMMAAQEPAARARQGRSGNSFIVAQVAAWLVEADYFDVVHWSKQLSAVVSLTTQADLLPVVSLTTQADLLRDIIGNPFQPVILSFAGYEGQWILQSTRQWVAIRQFARAIYDERRFEDMPILADALEEADCENEAILRHLRDKPYYVYTGYGNQELYEPVHVRGCWVLDLLLGKE